MGNILNIQEINAKELTVQEAREMVIMHEGVPYSYFDEGCTRMVFTDEKNTKVVKLVKKDWGIDYNIEESEIYSNAKDEDKDLMVRTKLVNGLIEQDFVEPIKFGGQKLTTEERIFAASCRGEVGRTEEGKLLCFDLDEYKKY